ncbi:GA module-containing protein, partial [Weissella minor]
AAKDAVDNATSQDEIDKAVDDAQEKNDAKANDPLADAKDEAKDKIDNMPNLTDAEKDAAKDAVDNATSQDEIDKAV